MRLKYWWIKYALFHKWLLILWFSHDKILDVVCILKCNNWIDFYLLSFSFWCISSCWMIYFKSFIQMSRWRSWPQSDDDLNKMNLKLMKLMILIVLRMKKSSKETFILWVSWMPKMLWTLLLTSMRINKLWFHPRLRFEISTISINSKTKIMNYLYLFHCWDLIYLLFVSFFLIFCQFWHLRAKKTL